MKEKPKLQALLETVLSNAVDNLIAADAAVAVSGMKFQIDMVTGEIFIYDDREALLGKNIIFEWANRHERGARPYGQPVHFLRAAIAGLKAAHKFDHEAFERPLTFTLVDDNFNLIENIYTISDLESSDGEGRLMKNLEHDLRIFAKKIFGEK